MLNEALSEITDEPAFKSAAPKEGGINIEGITVTPEGDFLIGLRSPLSSVNGGDALIVKLALSNGEFELAGSYQLALDNRGCLLYTSPSPRDATLSRMPSSA